MNALADLFHSQDVAVQNLAEHTDEVERGDAFLAVSPDVKVASQHARVAIEKGAVAVVSGQPIADLAVPNLVVDDLAARRGALAAEFYGEPSADLEVVGVTGTNGKTSVAYYVASLSDHLGTACGYTGTLGWGRVGALDELSLTTANAVAMQRRLARFAALDLKRASIEVSSHALDQGRVRDVHFDVAIFTNLSRDHLDYHETMEAYGQAKQKLFIEWPLKCAVLNTDDVFANEIRTRCNCPIITFGATGDWRWRTELADNSMQKVIWSTPDGEFDAVLPPMPEFALSNITAALAALSVCGHDIKSLGEALNSLSAVPGRMETLEADEGQALVVVDYAHTPDALSKALTALRPMCRERLIVVVGCGGDRDKGKRPEMAKVAADVADMVWLTSDNPRSEDPLEIIDEMRAGVSGGVVWDCVDRAEAIELAIQDATSADVVLIAGKGHETYQEVNGQRHPFDDREVARSVLAKQAGHVEMRSST